MPRMAGGQHIDRENCPGSTPITPARHLRKMRWPAPASAAAAPEHFQAEHFLAKAGMGTGSRQENGIKIKREAFSDLIE